MEIVLYQPEIAGNVGACIRLSANTGIPLNIIKPFGFSFQENKIRRAGLDYHDLASVSSYENWDEFISTNNNKNIAYLSAKGSNCLLYTSPSPRDRTRSRMPSSA